MYTIKSEKIDSKNTLYKIINPEGYPEITGSCGNKKDAESICHRLNIQYFNDTKAE